MQAKANPRRGGTSPIARAHGKIKAVEHGAPASILTTQPQRDGAQNKFRDIRDRALKRTKETIEQLPGDKTALIALQYDAHLCKVQSTDHPAQHLHIHMSRSEMEELVLTILSQPNDSIATLPTSTTGGGGNDSGGPVENGTLPDILIQDSDTGIIDA